MNAAGDEERRAFQLLVNPLSGGGAAAGAAVPVARLLRDAGARVEVTYSPGPQRCRELATQAVRRGEVVVAVGGDGMVASVAGAVGAAGGRLGLVPCGRGNDFARQLAIPQRPRHAGATAAWAQRVARTLLTAPGRPVDLVDVDGASVVGSVYAGVDSLASQLVDGAHRLPGPVQYPYAAVRALLTYPPADVEVDVDGTRLRERVATVVVANSGYYGAGMHIAPDAELDDGLLDVVVVRAASRLRLLRFLPRLYDGSHLDLEEVRVLRGRRVRLTLQDPRTPLTAYADGERLTDLPLTATVRPAALTVLSDPAGVDGRGERPG